jgi:hypothetical protein
VEDAVGGGLGWQGGFIIVCGGAGWIGRVWGKRDATCAKGATFRGVRRGDGLCR